MARLLATPGFFLAAVLLTAGFPSAQTAFSIHRTPGSPGGTVAESGDYWRTVIANGGQLPEHERLVVLAADGRILNVVEGDSARVVLPDDLAVQLSDIKARATLVHNHPANVSLSAADLDQLALAGIERVIAVGHDGSLYEASAGLRYGDGESLGVLYPIILQRVLADIVREARRGNANPAELFPHATHLVALILRRMQVIDYRALPSLPVRLVFDRYRGTIDRVVNGQGDQPIPKQAAAPLPR